MNTRRILYVIFLSFLVASSTYYRTRTLHEAAAAMLGGVLMLTLFAIVWGWLFDRPAVKPSHRDLYPADQPSKPISKEERAEHLRKQEQKELEEGRRLRGQQPPPTDKP